MERDLTVLGVAGSLRRASFNSALLRAAAALAPPGMTIEVFDLLGFPPYNPDDEPDLPPRAAEFRRRVRAAGVVLIATPEYNFSIPGMLKNAIDCASQPYGQNAWDGKLVALMGASVSSVGTARAQQHLRESLTALNCRIVGAEVLVGNAAEKFDAAGNLTDAKTCEAIRALLGASLAESR